MAISLPDISQKVVGDCAGLVNEFNRADNATRRSMARMDAEVGKFTKSIKNKFSGAELGKGLLTGLGIGSGFALAQTAADALVGRFQKQAEHAKSIEESFERQLNLTKQLIALRQTDDQKRSALEKEAANKWKELEAAKAPRFSPVPIASMGGYVKPVMVPAAQTNEQALEIARLTEEYQKLALAVGTAAKKSEEKAAVDRDALSNSDQMRKVAALAAGLKQQEDSFDALLKKQGDANEVTSRAREEAEKLAEKYRDIADPLRQYRQQIDEVNALHADGKLRADEMAAAIERIQSSAIQVGLNNFFGEMDKIEHATNNTTEYAREMGFAFSSAFEDAAFGAGKVSDILAGLIEDIGRMALRSAVTNPLMNAIFGGMAGWSALPSIWGGARAGGGPVSGGSAYLVGEKGPELFMPRRSGVVVPNDALRGSGGKGDTFNFSYSFSGGVSRSELMPLLAMSQRATVASIIDAKRRGGGAGRALA